MRLFLKRESHRATDSDDIGGIIVDNYEVEAIMRTYLEPQFLKDEKIMWCGRTENDAKPWEYSESKPIFIIIGICTLLGALLTGATIKEIISGLFNNVLSGLMVGLMLLGVAGFFVYVYFFYRKTRYYAVTNYRVYILDENGNIVYSRRMRSYYEIRYYASSRSVGWVEVFKKERKIGKRNQYYNQAVVTFRGIKDFEEAYHCIHRLIMESYNITDGREEVDKCILGV